MTSIAQARYESQRLKARIQFGNHILDKSKYQIRDPAKGTTKEITLGSPEAIHVATAIWIGNDAEFHALDRYGNSRERGTKKLSGPRESSSITQSQLPAPRAPSTKIN